MTSTAHGARARARTEITAAIKEEARRRLAGQGAAELSLRAVARTLGMASSAIYRYFPSRDDLLTALIVDAYDSLGEAAETAAEASADAAPGERWTAVCEAVRGWALAHPHEYALIYGSPVPGYAAPATTVPAASRVGFALIGVVRDAHRAGELDVRALPADLEAEAARMVSDFVPGLPPAAAPACVAVWAQLLGLIGFEVFGQFTGVVEERDAFFRHTVGGLARTVGLRPADAP
ncbi:TetR/AcrR family transcriptional regulator [Streptomyces sp. NPDC096105]|uniref:TetR/AcrR family transcriptional regulator n=1 Tax=Streptomyces sp. NPDC096105 TaxID=3366074 RepID=UPI003807F53B